MSHLNLTISELHALYVSGMTTPLNVVNEVIDALIKDKNNILEATMFDEARDFAATLKAVEEDNLLWGIPFLVKDNFATKGIETNGSSNILNGYIPLFDAEVVARLKALKAIPIAKTTLDELGMGGKGITGHKGITYNPYGEEKTRIVGGSSSGSASGVASGYVPFSLGSDTGDSIRKPASWAGIVGFKPTWGEISRFGLYSFMPTLDHVGFFTRSVYESAYLYEVTKGFDEKDFTTNIKPSPSVLSDITTPLKGRKIAVLKPIMDVMRNQNLIKEFNSLVQKLKDQGAIVDFIPFDEAILAAILPTYFMLSCAETITCNANLTGINFGNKVDGTSYEEIVLNTRTAGFSSKIKYRFLLGNFVLQKSKRNAYYDRAQRGRRIIVDAFNALFEKYDTLLLPAAPSHAPRIGEKSEPNSEIENNYMAIANFGGYPSITLPLGLDKGLPLGVNLTAHIHQDAKLLSIAYQIEQLTNLYNLHVGQVK